jgi:uncharacterized protein YndB with AHSA1/START domain
MTAPVATAGLLIRRPVADVFEAFVDPAITTRFWFTEASGRLETGAEVQWTWSMYGASTDVRVKLIEPNHRIQIHWDLRANPTEVEWAFKARGGQTFVEVVNRGFGEGDEQVSKALDAAGGFALVLGGAKIWLEHGIERRFVLDRHPDAWLSTWHSAQASQDLD